MRLPEKKKKTKATYTFTNMSVVGKRTEFGLGTQRLLTSVNENRNKLSSQVPRAQTEVLTISPVKRTIQNPENLLTFLNYIEKQQICTFKAAEPANGIIHRVSLYSRWQLILL